MPKFREFKPLTKSSSTLKNRYVIPKKVDGELTVEFSKDKEKTESEQFKTQSSLDTNIGDSSTINARYLHRQASKTGMYLHKNEDLSIHERIDSLFDP